MKKVSVVIPAYNKADLTVKTVESVLNQTYKNVEVIVVDDGSTDNTKERLALYADRIKYIHKENGGACSARNMGIRSAMGDYIALLDCDDMYHPHKIEKSAEYLDRNPDFGFVHTPGTFIDENGKRVSIRYLHKSPPSGWIAKKLFLRSSIWNSTVVIRKPCFEKVGFFDEKLFTHADGDMWLRLSEEHKAGYISEPLTLYRKSSSYILSHLEESKEEALKVVQKALQRKPDFYNPYKNRAISNVYLSSGIGYLKLNDLKKAKREFLLSIRNDAFNLKVLLLLVAVTVLRRNLILILKRLKVI